MASPAGHGGLGGFAKTSLKGSLPWRCFLFIMSVLFPNAFALRRSEFDECHGSLRKKINLLSQTFVACTARSDTACEAGWEFSCVAWQSKELPLA